MKINIGFHARGIKSAEIILSTFEKPQLQQDSLNKHYGKASFLIPKLLVTKTAYNSLTDEGMRIVKNDSLRNAIVNHYENIYKFLLDWNEDEWNVQFQDTRDVYRKYLSKFSLLGDLSGS